ncbi:hypothetical protein PNEG_01773 [Pneumocystis murina B123]|uniref:Midasin n=1 Tax=Pneumocystis murina (strain B123) TaxID=1069680 RepID=M7NMV8_PNEMU|nr:hypothetical protein PNEG_01773 [Pneumocystis murina B123]EMR10018.1 hypothetical protein PNEG_01773 [Pneumocystis murina B123]
MVLEAENMLNYEEISLELVRRCEISKKFEKNLTSEASSNKIYLDTISVLLLEEKSTLIVAELYYPVLAMLVARWESFKEEKIGEIMNAYAKLLPLKPSLKPYAIRILNGSSIFINRLDIVYGMENEEKESESVSFIVRHLVTIYRLIIFDPHVFSCFVSIFHVWPFLFYKTRIIRFLAVEILCILLCLSSTKREELVSLYVGQGCVDYLYSGKVIDYSFFCLFENESKRMFLDRIRNRNYFSTNGTRVIHDSDQSHLLVSICGIYFPRTKFTIYGDSDFFMTPVSRKNMENFARALLTQKPVLLLGLCGVGKTFMVESVAKILGKYDDLVRIYLGDQIDIRSLIGTYTSSTPGVFEWKPGVLTRAVQEGKYVLIEDIDKASNDIISVLLPLLEKNELEIPSRGEKINADFGFQIIATMSINIYQKSDIKLLGNRLWEIVNINEIPMTELSELVCSKFPILKKLSQKIIEVYGVIVATYNDPVFHSLSKIAFRRVVSMRDLMKWSKRILYFLNNSRITLEDDYISKDVVDSMFYNAVDCFSGMIQTGSGKSLIIQKIAEVLGYSSDWAEFYIKSYIPRHEDFDDYIKVGRVNIQKSPEFTISRFDRYFTFTSPVLRLLEQLGASAECGEHVLLVGETGTGKTTTIQYFANILGRELIIVNMSQQTENTDLLGGFKPVDLKTVSTSLKNQFDDLFSTMFSIQKNFKFLEATQKAYSNKKWKYMLRLFRAAIDMAQKQLGLFHDDEKNDKMTCISRKKKRCLGPELKQKLESFSCNLANFEKYVLNNPNCFFFDFVEGPLTRAVKNGTWILLDEINLAEFGVLENIASILQENGSVLLSEKGDIQPIYLHPNFRLFACMNPVTDIGRHDLSLSLRSRFTEFYVYSPDENFNDLLAIIHKYIGHLSFSDQKVLYDVAQLHLKAKQLEKENRLIDSAGQKPYYNIRTLTRTLMYVNEICHLYGLHRSLYEGFCMLYLTLLDRKSEEILHPIIKQHTFNHLKNLKSSISQIPKKPSDGDYIQFKHYWVPRGNYEIQKDDDYIITQTIEKNMLNLIRAITTRKFSVLIQGPTSSGKTSMIQYVSKLTGHKFVRINNHEHIELQEYFGAYVSDDFGNLKFKEGIMVEALRNGYWIVLDELNLAPSEILEALNRLLDDNRELFILETQETVKPHPHFMLFATQNPPGIYGGRKRLSSAFRNRFLELHYDNIPEDELKTIICNRCHIPPSYSTKMVEVYKKLSLQRESSRIFEQKTSFMTLRDLFRWASRDYANYQEFVNNGYMLLGERVRKNDEKIIVKEIIETVMKVKISENELYNFNDMEECISSYNFPNLDGIVWTKAMKRLFRLISLALENDEPVLLVGETGTGKTSICQAIAKNCSSFLHIVNVHQNTESGDIIGTQRPVRNKDIICKRLYDNIFKLLVYLDPINFNNNQSVILSDLVTAFLSLDINDIRKNLKDIVYKDIIDIIEKDLKQYKKLFDWYDGALVKAMKSGEYFLLDEISLADDSVLERLNSVLEISRTITLTEKSVDENLIKAKDGFKFMATMNPGSDYGKRELSPALRNRFTEIWVPSGYDEEDVLKIVSSKLKDGFYIYSKAFVSFSFWFQRKFSSHLLTSISIRDILTWVDYVNLSNIHTSMAHCILHGAALVYIDKIGVNMGFFSNLTKDLIREKRLESVDYLSRLVGEDLHEEFSKVPQVIIDKEILKIGPFSILRGPDISDYSSYSFNSPTTSYNAMRILRAMQTSRPILLEGSPGVGKTSLISAIASVVGFRLIRINLSEQTDLMDLFGSDLPVDDEATKFAWHDGPFLQAMKNGYWVLLDEMNLASQSILEGLNACLDHRAQAFIPELNQTFTCHPSFRVFAAQNPHSQGCGRKGLPKSFINRFVVVYIEELSLQDLLFICDHVFPNEDLLIKEKIVSFIERLNDELSRNRIFGIYGSPWEFNLRDILRWLEILQYGKLNLHKKDPSEFLDIIIKQKFRTIEDRKIVDRIYQEIFGNSLSSQNLYYRLSSNFLQVGHALLPRNSTLKYNKDFFFNISTSHLKVIESLISCIQFNWPCVLVGPPASGKTFLIRFISSISGSRLVEFSINNDIDTMDIVGGFEQMDLILELNKFIISIEEFCNDRLRSLIVLPQKENLKYANIYSRILELIKVQGRHTVSHYRKFLSDLVLLFTELSNMSMICDFSFQQIFQRLKKYVLVDDTYKPSQFKWFDSILLQAIKNGDWLLLDNANLCNSSVLDRLNSLMEPKGNLVLNERNSLNGSPFLINSHSNFRIFLTMDPANGELSRAMRNRCVEIFCDKVFLDDHLESICTSSGLNYNDSVLFTLLPSFMFNHFYLYGKILKRYYSQKNIFILGDIFLEQIPIKQIDLLKSWYLSYVIESGIFSQIKKDDILNLIHKCFEFQKSSLYQMIFDFYKNIIHDSDFLQDFINIQPLYPLGNPYIENMFFGSLSCLYSTGFRSRHIKLSYLYNLFSKYLDLKIILETVQEKSRNISEINMTVLEKSCMNLHYDDMDSLFHINAFHFLSSLLNEIGSLLIDGDFDYVNQEFTEAILDLANIWHQIYEFTNSPLIEYTKYHVYNDNLREWNKKYESLLPADSRKRFLQLIESFNLNLELKTGFSMENIWKKVRPSVPKFEYTWSVYKELMSYMNKFDNSLQYNVDTLDIILNIRTLFLENCHFILTFSNDIEENPLKNVSFQINFKIQDFIEDLRNNINRIDIHCNPSIKSGCLYRVTESFNVIFSCMEVYLINYIFKFDIISKEMYDMIIALSIWTDRSSISLIPYIIAYKGTATNESLIFQLFDSYFAVTDIPFSSSERFESLLESPSPFIFFGRPIKTVAIAIYNIKNALFQDFEKMKSCLSNLVSQVFRYTLYIKNDKIMLFIEIFIRKIIQIFSMHKSLYSLEDYQVILTIFKEFLDFTSCNQKKNIIKNLEELKKILQKTYCEKLKMVINTYFVSSLSIICSVLENIEVTESELVLKLGKAFIFFELGFLYLYVPNIPYDPAIFPIVQMELHKKELEDISNEILLRKLYENEFTGSTDNFSIKKLQIRYQNLESKKIVFPYVYRPSVSDIISIYREFEKLLKIFIIDQSLENIIKGFENGDISAVFQLNTMQKTIYKLVNRLESYLYYADILKPICGSLKAMNFSLVLIKQGEMFSKCLSEDLTMKIFLNLFDIDTILTKSFDISFIILFLEEVSKYKLSKMFVDRFMIFCLKKLCFFKRSLLLDESFNYMEIVDYIFLYFYSKWAIKRDEKIKEELEKESIYKISHFQGNATEYQSLFPEFESIESEIEYKSSKIEYHNQCHIELMMIHRKFFNESESLISSSELVNSALNLGIELLTLETLNINSKANGIALPSLIYYMRGIIEDSNFTLPTLQNSDDWVYNFYTDPNIKESLKLVSILKDLKFKAEQLFEKNPENFLLHEIINRSDIILKSGIEDPLSQTLIALEQLYSTIDEWKKIAGSECSLDINMENIKNLIITWRKFELSCWNDLFKLEDKEKYNETVVWWFYLYENLIYKKSTPSSSIDDLEKYRNELVSLLEQFIISSPLGQFEKRLELIHSFSCHLDVLEKIEFSEKRILFALKNLVALYSSYLPKIRNAIYQGKRPLEKSIRETIQLMSWKDTNVYVLKESSRKSHRSLYKIVKKYRELISLSSFSILTEPCTESLLLNFQHNSSCDLSQLELVFVNEELLKWSLDYCKSVNFTYRLDAPPRHRNIMNTVRNMWSIVIQKYGQDSTCENPFELFTINVVENMKELQNLTPSSMDNVSKSEISYLKTRKKKLFFDTIAELKRMGLKINPSIPVINKVTNINNLLTNIPYYDIKLKNEESASSIRTINEHFYQLLTFISKIHRSQSKCSNDISVNEISRSCGLLNSLFYMLLLERSALMETLFKIQHIERNLSILSFLETMTFEENISFIKNYRKTKYIYDRSRSFLKHIQNIIGILEDIRATHLNTCFISLLHELEDDFNLINNDIEKFIAEFESLGGQNRIVIDKFCDTFVSNFMIWMEKIFEKMFSYSIQSTPCAYLVTPILTWIKDNMDSLKLIHLDVSENQDISLELDIFMRNLSDKICLIIQKLVDTKSLDTKQSPDGILEDSWLLKKHKFLLSSLSVLEIENINRLLDRLITDINDLNTSGFSNIQILFNLKAIYCLSAPILNQYLVICEYILKNFMGYHKSLTKSVLLFSLVLNTLIEKGFCTPVENTINEKDSVTEGTELVNGNGVEDTINDHDNNENFNNLDNMDSQKNDYTNMGDDIKADDDFDDTVSESNYTYSSEDFNDENLDDELGEIDYQNSSTVNEEFWDKENNESKNDIALDSKDLNNDGNKMGANPQEYEEKMPLDPKKDYDLNDDKKHDEIIDNEETLENVEKSEFNEGIDHIDPLDLPENLHLDDNTDKDNTSDNNSYLDMSHQKLDYNESDFVNNDFQSENDLVNKPEADSQIDSSDDKQIILDKHEENIKDNDRNKDDFMDNDGNKDDFMDNDGNKDDFMDNDGNKDDFMDNDGNKDDFIDNDPEKDFEEGGNHQVLNYLVENLVDKNDSAVLSTNEDFHKKYENNESFDKEYEGNENGMKLEVKYGQLTCNKPGTSKENNDSKYQGNSAGFEKEQEFDFTESLNDSYRSLGNVLEQWNRIINDISDSKNHDDSLDNDELNEDVNQYEYMKDSDFKGDAQVVGFLPEKEEKNDFDMEKDNPYNMNNYDLNTEKISYSYVDSRITDVENLDSDISGAEIGYQKMTNMEQNINEVSLQNMTNLHEKSLGDTYFHTLSDSLDLISVDDAVNLWRIHENSVHDLSIHLCEQLRLILEPTLATKMQGDYRTGKRLNMRRIIPYIASQYRKDKIWMRRTKPSKRQYQVMICMDDSRSMAESGSMNLAFETLALISKSLSLLEVGEICIMSFGDKPLLIHPFKEPFTSQSGAKLVRQFKFNQSTTDLKALTEISIDMFNNAKNTLHIKSALELWQLEIIVSDGICDDHDSLRLLLRKARELKIMVIFVIIDIIHEKKTTSLLDMKQVRYKTMGDGSTSLEIIHYMDEFAFDHFLIVRDVKELPQVLANALRQWFMQVSVS